MREHIARLTPLSGDKGTLTISGGAIGASGNKITIDNFDLAQARTPAGYLGIHLKDAISISAGSGLNASAFSGAGLAADVPKGNTQTCLIQCLGKSTVDRQYKLSGGKPNSCACTGKGSDLLVAREVLFVRVKCEAANDIEGRIAA